MPSQETANRSSASAYTVARSVIITLGVLGIGSFFAVYTYLDRMQPPQVSQVAAVATASPFDNISIEGKAAIVVDLSTGEVLYAKNPDAQLPLASITKVPLMLVVGEVMDTDDVITIPYNVGATGNAQPLLKGDRWKVQDLIDYTLVASSNEGADILASAAEAHVRAKYPLAPQEGATLWRMNNLATDLNLTNTYFLNPSGLDESLTQSGAYGSPRDVAKIFAYAANAYPRIFAGTAKNGLLLTTEYGNETSVKNTNEALGEIPGLIMGKTGFTDLAGGNLAVVFDVGLAHPVVAVVLGSSKEGRFLDTKKIVETSRKAVARE